MKGSVHYTRKVIPANSNILWTNKLTGNISDYDE